jgi:hypothetical protein
LVGEPSAVRVEVGVAEGPRTVAVAVRVAAGVSVGVEDGISVPVGVAGRVGDPVGVLDRGPVGDGPEVSVRDGVGDGVGLRVGVADETATLADAVTVGEEDCGDCVGVAEAASGVGVRLGVTPTGFVGVGLCG